MIASFSRRTVLTLSVIVTVLAMATLSATAQAADTAQALFINLTSDDTNRAAMAINFATLVRQKKNIPVTVFLNVDGVRLADRTIPQTKNPAGKTAAEMLSAFMAAGGEVIICPMCMKNVGGLAKSDLLDGVKMGGPDVTWPALFADGTTVLSY